VPDATANPEVDPSMAYRAWASRPKSGHVLLAVLVSFTAGCECLVANELPAPGSDAAGATDGGALDSGFKPDASNQPDGSVNEDGGSEDSGNTNGKDSGVRPDSGNFNSDSGVVDAGCVPKTCGTVPADCGSPSDGCGGVLSCGSCVAPQSCAGGGVPYQCGCSPATCADLHRVWGDADDDVFAVGTNGTVLRYDGTTWQPQTSGTAATFLSVWGTSGTDIWAVGDKVLAHYDGSSWDTNFTPPVTGCTTTYDVWGSSSNSYIGGACSNAYISWNGSLWAAMSSNGGSGGNRSGINGCAANDVWATDDLLGWAYHYNGTSWSQLYTNTPWIARYGVACLATGDVLFVGTTGDVLHYNGTRYLPERSGTTSTLRAVANAGTFGAMAVGDSGVILRRVGGVWQPVPSGTSLNLGGVWVSATGKAWIVGDQQFTLLVDLAADCPMNGTAGGVETGANCGAYCGPCPTGQGCKVGSDCASLVCSGGTCAAPTCTDGVQNGNETDVDCGGGTCPPCAVGKMCLQNSDCGGTAACVNYVCTEPDLYRVWGTSDSQIFAVGTAGTILEYDGTRWSKVSSGTGMDFHSVFGVSNVDAWAVGAGVIAHFNGTTWDSTFPDPMSYSLNDVWGSGLDAYQAVGDDAFIQYNGNSWATETGAPPGAKAISGCSASDIWAVSDIYEEADNWNGTAWQTTSVSNQLVGVVCVGSNSVFAVGSSGLISPFDGSSWYSEISGVTTNLDGIANGASLGLFAVGTSGTLLRRVATNFWQVVPTSTTTTTLHSAWVSPTGIVWVVGDSGFIQSFNIASQCPNNGTVGGVETGVDCGGYCGPCPPGQTCRVGFDCASRICQGGTCTTPTCTDGVQNGNETDVDCGGGTCPPCATGKKCVVNTDCAGTDFCTHRICTEPNLTAIWGASDTDIFAVGSGGAILNYNGTAWSRMTSGTSNDFLAIYGTSSSDVWAVGSDVLAHFDGTSWNSSYTGPTGESTDYLAVWGSSPSFYEVGHTGGNFIKWNGSAWVPEPSNPGGPGKSALSGCNGSDIWATDNALGWAYQYSGSTWSLDTSVPSTVPRYGVACVSKTLVIFVGQGGSVIDWNGTAFSTETSGVTADLHAISASGSTVVAVGNSGTWISRSGTGSWSTVNVGTTENLMGVWVSPTTGNAWAVGANATIVNQ
jgi:hypothetical protein